MKRLYKSLVVMSCVATLGVFRAASDSVDTPDQAAARKAMEERLQGKPSASAPPSGTVQRVETPQAAIDAFNQKLQNMKAAPASPTTTPQAAIDAFNQKLADSSGRAKHPVIVEPPAAAVEAFNHKLVEVSDQKKAMAAQIAENQAKAEVAMNDLKRKLDDEAKAKLAVVSKSIAPAPMASAMTPAGPQSKAVKLALLLADYRADKLTPHLYHTKRVAILNESKN